MARSKWGFIAFITLEMTTKRVLARESLFICGNTRTEHGRSRESSVTIITLPLNDSIALVFLLIERQRVCRKKLTDCENAVGHPYLQTGLSTYSNTGPPS